MKRRAVMVMLCFATASCSSGGPTPEKPTPPATRPSPWPLVDAIEKGDDAAAFALIATGQNLDQSRGQWRTPVAAAIETGNLPVLRALIAAGATFDPAASSAIYVNLAASSGRWEMFEFIRSACPDLTGRHIGQTALQALAIGLPMAPKPDAGRIAVALLGAGVDPHSCGEGPRVYPPFAALPMAAMNPYRASLVKTLLDRVQFSPAELDLAIDRATTSGAVESILLLQQKRAEAKLPPPSPKWLGQVAGRYDTAAAIEAFLAAGADVNATVPKLGRTALHRAVASGDAVGVRVLLDHGADVAALDDDALQQTCIDLAETRLKRGREHLSDSPYPSYDSEQPGHESTAGEVMRALREWLAAHPAADARLAAAGRDRSQTRSAPQPTPEAAIAAYVAASIKPDAAALRSLVLLPTPADRRQAVLRSIAAATSNDLPAGDTRPSHVTAFSTVAVAHCTGKMYWADGGKPGRSGSMDVPIAIPLALRDGGWLVVLDVREGGGLTAEELKAIGPAMRENDRQIDW